MASVTLDIPVFRARFTAFSDEVLFPDSLLNGQWVLASNCFFENQTNELLGIECLTELLYLMLAHLLHIYAALNGIIDGIDGVGGDNPQIIKTAVIDDVQVTVETPPFGTDYFTWWISKSPYGEQLFASLSVLTRGGFYIGGSRELDAFRKAGGGF